MVVLHPCYIMVLTVTHIATLHCELRGRQGWQVNDWLHTSCSEWLFRTFVIFGCVDDALKFLKVKLSTLKLLI